MVTFITLITIIHATLFAFDDYILNKRRDLSRREINGALIDGLLFLSIVALTLFTTFSSLMGNVYIALSVLSCLSIIKNELFYENIPRDERLVHAGLYVVHPLILYAFYRSWEMSFFTINMTYWMLQLCYLILGVKAISYHVIYWNYMHETQEDK
ncbi:MAG: hypothetical protein HON90_08850, partial [Halobacteriovoraceae bacterium]|nr:hypothetical protein [Halobacteriovoraceae bacterium]